MKNKNLHTVIAYWILALALVLFISGCRTKKSTTDFKQTEIENVSIADNSTVRKNQTVQVNNKETSAEIVTDKSLFEAWMSFESDKITITDTAGNKTEITNPRINKKSLQTNDIAKTNQTDIESNKVAASEENKQNNVAVSNNRQIKSDVSEKHISKGKEPIWLWIVGGCVVGGLGYLILKRFGLV